VDVTYSVPTDQDALVYDAFDERPDKPVRLRFQPDVFRINKGERGRYDAWRGVHWSIECTTPGEAIALKNALLVFFDAARELGPDKVRDLLMAPDEARPVEAGRTAPAASGETNEEYGRGR